MYLSFLRNFVFISIFIFTLNTTVSAAPSKTVVVLFDVSGSVQKPEIKEQFLDDFQTILEATGANNVIAADKIAKGLCGGMTDGSEENPENQLAEGCLVDQLVGQTMAHICGLGYLHDSDKVKTTLQSILHYNRKAGFEAHFNCMRSYVLGDETALLMAAYPGARPENPFPYFTEVMTGFEWVAAVGMLYEGMVDEGLACIEAIRNRYDGNRRNPYNEAECGHHYARAMAAWSAALALTGFHYSAVTQSITFACPEKPVIWFWASGYAWGTCAIDPQGAVKLSVLTGKLALESITVTNLGSARVSAQLGAGEEISIRIEVAGN